MSDAEAESRLKAFCEEFLVGLHGVVNFQNEQEVARLAVLTLKFAKDVFAVGRDFTLEAFDEAAKRKIESLNSEKEKC